jgi:hypothetical protein
MLQDQVKAMNYKIFLNSQEYAKLAAMFPGVQEYGEVLARSARIDQPPGKTSIRSRLTTQGSILTRILLIILVALLIVGLIALAISVFTVH